MVLARWRVLRRTAALSVALVAWTWAGVAATGAIAVSTATESRARAGTCLVVFVAAVFAIGGLVLFWGIAGAIRFAARGYRVRPSGWIMLSGFRLRSGTWVYEERAPDGKTRSLSFTRTVLADKYPALTEVRVPAAGEWDARCPAWARGRRELIVNRVVALTGGPSYTRVAASE